MLDRCELGDVKTEETRDEYIPKSFLQKHFWEPCLLCFANGELYFVLPPEQNQHGARGMGKKSIYYGSVSSLSFRFFVFCPFRFIPFFCLKREKCDCNILYLFYENGVIFQFRLLIACMGKGVVYMLFSLQNFLGNSF